MVAFCVAPSATSSLPDVESIPAALPPRSSFAPSAAPPSAILNTTKERGNQDHWMAALDGLDDATAKVCKSFGEPRYEVLQRLVRAGAEHPRWEAAPVQNFINAPESFIEPLHSERLHLFVEPAPGVHGRRYKFKEITVPEAIAIADGLHAFPEKDRYVVTVVESPKLLYHGNVTVFSEKDCNPGGNAFLPQVTGEFVSGESQPVSRGAQPEFRIWQEPYLETYRYDFTAPEVRRTLFKALEVIPKSTGGLGVRPKLLPGYYEIGITAGTPSEPSRAYLYDMKSWESL